MLLQQDFNTGLFRVLQHVMGKLFRTIHGQQVLATLFTFARYSWLAKLGYGYLAMISRLLSLANWRHGSARNRLRLRLKTAKSLSRGNTSRTKNQILLVKVNKQMFIHPVRHLTVMLTNCPPVSHASHDSQTMCLDDVVDVAEQEHQCCICTAWILTSTTKISKLCLQGTISVTSQVVYP